MSTKITKIIKVTNKIKGYGSFEERKSSKGW